ncbi:hypothetical protein [Exiguobacterium mexicanum]|uniref:hypothetical protein n=1 Tax=Exiguobacterium mexicanum TaxID=340146 RepID=UPI00384D9942
MPVFQDDVVVGVVVVKIAIDITGRVEMIREYAHSFQSLAKSLEYSSIEGIDEEARLKQAIENMLSESEQNQETFEGLKAQVGDFGKGFNVVATKVCNLSKLVERAVIHVRTTPI